MNLKKTRILYSGNKSAMVSCLNATTHTDDDPLGSKHFALNSTYKVVLTVHMVSSEKKFSPASEVLEFRVDIQINISFRFVSQNRALQCKSVFG